MARQRCCSASFDKTQRESSPNGRQLLHRIGFPPGYEKKDGRVLPGTVRHVVAGLVVAGLVVVDLVVVGLADVFTAELFAGVLIGLLCTDDDAGLLAEDEAGRADELAAALLFAEDAGTDELAAALLLAEDAPADELAAALLCPEADETPDGAPDADPDADEEGIGGGIEKADEETNTIEPVDTPDTGGGTAEEDPDGKYDMPDGRAVEVAVIGVSEKE
ncbi:hypothetical protein C8R44DRAFT_945835 [Mycena epipterygia]|nr:hypothetical protein C8R44DRAFT_945835 [Mycena epipterygia]